MNAQPTPAEATEHPGKDASSQEACRFLPLGAAFARADMAIATLARHAWSQRHAFLGDEGKRIVRRSGLRRLVPEVVFDLRRVGRMLLHFLAARARPARVRSLALPVRGDLAIERKSGAIKVLDLGRERVYTLMLDPAHARKLRERVDYARSVERHRFAPALHDVAVDHGYFAESYLHGTRPRNFRGCFEGFEASYLGLLVALARAEPPEPRPLAQHAGTLRRTILAPDGLARRLPHDAFERVRRRAEASAAIVEAADGDVPLTLSHGDFFSGNIVVGNDRAWAIDWAHVGRRGPLHDLYYLAMAHCYRVLEPRLLHARFHEMREALRSALHAADPERAAELDPWLTGDSVARHLFYLECIEVPLTRCDSPDDRYVHAMLQRVDAFDAFEAAIRDEGAPPSVTPDATEAG